jgi:alpha-amylase
VPSVRRAVTLLAIVALLQGCAGATSPSPTNTTAPPPGPASPSPAAAPSTCASPPIAADLPDWNDRIFYELFVRSFQDSDGDGIGDLRGLIDRLDYLNDGDPATDDDLGVTGLWLMPIAESPSYHGYDVVDYRAIEQDYGSLEDFRVLLDEAHARGIAVIVDFVMNHTSREHPWFVDARTPGSEHEDWYLWADERPRGVVKPGGDRVWHEDGERFYYAYFWEGMPDLNLDSPEVTAELDGIARFWLEEVGVDGFRLDAIKHLFEDGAELEDVPETKVWLEGFHDRVDAYAPDALLLGEAYDVTSQASAYVPESVDLTFDFGLADSILIGVDNGSASPIRSQLAETVAAYPPGQFATFLTNHDQPRVATRLGGSLEAAAAAATAYLTAPGVPFIYYGEEIGTQGTKPDERIRTPMAWTAEAPGAGFTEERPWQPVAEGADTANVAAQADDPDSLLSHYRDLIRLRVEHEALRGPDAVAVETTERSVLAVARRSADELLLVLVNLGDAPLSGAALDLTAVVPCGTNVAGAEVLLGDAEVAPIVDAAAWVPVETLDPYEPVVLRLTP